MVKPSTGIDSSSHEDPSTHDQAFWREDEYAGVYDAVAELAIKEKLDEMIQRVIEERVQPGSRILDLGCGRALISRRLASGRDDTCVGVDVTSDMIGQSDLPENVWFLTSDITESQETVDSLEALGFGRGSFDAAMAENVWYAVTAPEDTSLPMLSEEVALERRHRALLTMAAMIKEGGILVLNDPLDNSRDMGLAGILRFLWFELRASHELGRPLTDIVSNTLSKQMVQVRERNKWLLAVTHMFRSSEEERQAIENGGYFEVEEITQGVYMGLGALYVARRTGKPVVLNEEK